MDIFGLKGLLLLMLVFVPLERLFPAHRDQPVFRPQWQTDLIYVLLNGVLIRLGLVIVILSVTAFASWAVPQAVRDWTGALPFAVQVIMLLVVSDLGFYGMHRLFHTPMLWRFHAVHHSIEHLDWLAAHRVHPVDQILTKAGSFIPVFVLGFSESAILFYSAIYFWHSILLHSNLRINFGPLRWVFASPQFHHWHHANHPDAYDKNFAGQLPVLDLLFGTFRVPGRTMPERYGTDDPVPDGYLSQLVYPFKAPRPVPDPGLQAEKG